MSWVRLAASPLLPLLLLLSFQRPPAATAAGDAAERAMLFFDGHFLAASNGLAHRVGKAWLLSAFNDSASDSYVGWGYPSVFTTGAGQPHGWRMLYQGWPLAERARSAYSGRVVLLAESDDAVHWRPAELPGCPGVPAKNCVYLDAGELSFVFDDSATAPPQERLKAMSDLPPRISVSADGLRWRPWGNWTSQETDPGYSVFRNPVNSSEVVVTARPQALRSGAGPLSGRHAGFHWSKGWAGLRQNLNQRALPLDDLFEEEDQIYGLPSFAYGGMVVSYFWRYHCRPNGYQQRKPDEGCFRGGVVSAALAFSYNSRNWSAFGLPTSVSSSSSSALPRGGSTPAPASSGLIVVGRKLLNNTDLGMPTSYHHSYKHYANKTAGALACQRECDGDSQCSGWTYVTGDDASGQERCCRHSAFGCPRRVVGYICAAKRPTTCKPLPPPLPPGEPPLPGPHRVPLPELFPNVPGTPSSAQVYPNTLIQQPERGRILVHASASTHQHGFVSAKAGAWSSLLTYQLRWDGFVYVEAASPSKVAGAWLTTVPVAWVTGELYVNADCAGQAGNSVKVAVLETGGQAVPGYSLADAVPMQSNSTNATALWRKGRTMGSLGGRTVSIHVSLTGGAKLYALRGRFL